MTRTLPATFAVTIAATLTATLAALVVGAVFAATAAPTAVELQPSILAGDHFRKPVTLDQDLKTEGGQLLRKGSYDVDFSTIGGDKVNAVFFQGGIRKGETQGIIIVGGSPARSKVRAASSALKLSDLGLGTSTPHKLRKQNDKVELAVGNQGSSQILIGMLVPAALTRSGVIAPPQKQ